MPKLILSMDGLVLKEIVLDKPRTTIGRKPNNDVQIDNLAISGQHAVITTILEDAFLEDQNSTNGTYVNGQPIKKHVLRNNDLVELGKYRLKYIVDAPAPAVHAFGYAAAAADGAVFVPPEVAPAPGAAASPMRSSPAASPAAGGGALGVMQLLNGPNAGRELELTKSLTTLGKPGKQVAAITRRVNGYFLTHVEGEVFPLVNGSPLDAQARRLDEHDIVELAGVKMEFFLRP
ncbi:FHA domain-containing protein [Azoarcus sp. PA01]|nr:FHA domain-containing protein [Azoarcus sp. PA01]